MCNGKEVRWETPVWAGRMKEKNRHSRFGAVLVFGIPDGRILTGNSVDGSEVSKAAPDLWMFLPAVRTGVPHVREQCWERFRQNLSRHNAFGYLLAHVPLNNLPLHSSVHRRPERFCRSGDQRMHGNFFL